MLTCTDSTRVTTQTKWMQGLVKKMVRVEFQRALTAENKREGSGDHSCEPICLSMIKDIVNNILCQSTIRRSQHYETSSLSRDFTHAVDAVRRVLYSGVA